MTLQGQLLHLGRRPDAQHLEMLRSEPVAQREGVDVVPEVVGNPLEWVSAPAELHEAIGANEVHRHGAFGG